MGSMEKMALTNLDTLANGAVAERFGAELRAVIRNIMDPNTKATAARSVTVKVTLKPDETRQVATVAIEAKPTLAPAQPVVTTLMIGIEADGTVMATEVGKQNQLPGQIDVDGNTFDPRSAGLTVIGGGMQ